MGVKWTEYRELTLRRMFRQESPVRVIAQVLGMGTKAVHDKLERMGLRDEVVIVDSDKPDILFGIALGKTEEGRFEDVIFKRTAPGSPTANQGPAASPVVS